MRTKKTGMRLLAAAAVVSLTMALGVGVAFADDSLTSEVTGGSLSITDPEDPAAFSGVTLDGTAQTATTTLNDFTVTDARGTGAGWNVTMVATQFTNGEQTLDEGSLSFAEPSVSKADPTSSDLPAVAAGPYDVDVTGGVEIASAAADGTGMGSYTFDADMLTLSYDASAYAGTYTSTLTISVATGP